MNLPSGSVIGAWLGVVGLAWVMSAGCGSRAEPVGRAPSEYCSRHIDALITANVVPNADREYATGMCERSR